MKYQRLGAVCLVALLVTSVFGIAIGILHEPTETRSEKISFAGGSGTLADPYMIENVDQLQNITQNLTAHYELANDIDAGETSGWSDGDGFEPVGDDDNSFTGSLEGSGYTITNMYIDRTEMDHVGLFGNSQGYIDNVHLVDAHVSGNVQVGGLVGWNEGTVSNSSAAGNVNGYAAVGGLVGANIEGVVSNSYATGSVSGDDGVVGGLVGLHREGTVENSYATGNVSGDWSVGGLVGYNWYRGTVENSYATGNVSGTDWYVGGLVGLNYYGTVNNSYATGNVSGDWYVGGLVGLSGGTVSNSFYNIDSVLINDGHHITIGGIFDEQYQDWFNNDMYLNISDYDDTLVPVDDHYEISSTDGLRDLLGFAHREGYEFKLGDDIDLSGDPGLYVPYLAAEFYGNDYDISNLHIDIPFAAQVGMFGCVNDGMILDVSLIDADVSGADYVGGLVGFNWEGTVENSYATGYVTGNERVGGLVGANFEKVYNSYAKGNVSGRGRVGGLVGYNWDGTVSNSYATGNVSGGERVGGLVGSNYYGTVSNSYATGSVSGDRDVGGLVGENRDTVIDSYAAGNVTGEFVGIGGLVGMNDGIVSNSYAAGNVDAEHADHVGGLVGENRNIVENTYSIGDVDGTQHVGGLIGDNREEAVVSNSYAVGEVSGDHGVGGLVGINVGDASVENSFWDTETTGQDESDGGTGKTTAEMKDVATFTDLETDGLDEPWDFVGDPNDDEGDEDIWDIDDNEEINDGYPFLRWEELTVVDIELTTSEEADDWNFVSFDLIPVDTSLETILEDEVYGITGSYEKVMYYDAGADEWLTYVPGREDHFNNLEQWDHTMGVWIQMNQDDTLTVEGDIPSSTDIVLEPGWNMVGYPSESSGNHGLPDEVTKIGYFNASEENNLAYDYNPEQFIFEPGQGYWVYNGAEEPVTWTVEY